MFQRISLFGFRSLKRREPQRGKGSTVERPALHCSWLPSSKARLQLASGISQFISGMRCRFLSLRLLSRCCM